MTETMRKIVPETETMGLAKAKSVKIYPTFQIDSDDLPEVDGWKYKDKKTITVEVEVMSVRQGKEWQGSSDKDDKVHVTVKILKIGAKPTDETSEQEYARKRSNAPRV